MQDEITHDEDYRPNTFDGETGAIAGTDESEQPAADSSLRGEWHPVETVPPLRRFISGQGWTPRDKPYVLVVDAKGRMSVGYAMAHAGEKFGYRWIFAKPIGIPTHWMPLPEPPAR